MSILDQLGLDHTYFFQLAIFIFAVIVLSQFIFKDFVAMLAQRDQNTGGSVDRAEGDHEKTMELSKNYEEVARKINGEIKSIFDFYRQEASAESEKNLNSARQSATKLMDETRRRVQAEVGDASKKIREEAPLVAKEIVKKLMSGSEKTL